MNFILYLFLFLIILGILLLTIFTIELIATYKIYKKAGYKGWESLIPFYNNWILIKITELNEWYFLALLSPTLCTLINIEELTIISYLIYLTTTFFIYYNISKKFNKDLFFTILMIIFPYIMFPILAFNKNNIYNPNIKVSKHGPIGDNTSNNNYNANDNQLKYCNSCGNKIDNNANFCRHCGTKIYENQ